MQHLIMQAADVDLIGRPHRPRDKQNSRMTDAADTREPAIEKKVICRGAYPGADGRENRGGGRSRHPAKNVYCHRKMPSRHP